MQGYCKITEYTGSLGYNSVSDGCLKKNQNRCTRLWGKNKCQNVSRLGGIKGCKVLKENSERYITSRNGWVSLIGISGGIYVELDVILVHIKTRLDLLGIQTFRWDQRLQLQNFFMALGRQYSNLNRHVSTQEKQNQRQYSTPSSMVL